jgi:4-aminobutyrate aminotransferase-like enzyme
MTMPAEKINDFNTFKAGNLASLDARTADRIRRRHNALGSHTALFYSAPLTLVSGEGVWLVAEDGRRYLDAYNNVPSVGHCHPVVVKALSAQAALLNTHTRYLFDVLYDYSERLLATYPSELSNIVFTSTGSESNDLALRIAERSTGNSGVIVTEYAYHGNTKAVSEVSPSSGAEFLGAHVRLVPAPRDAGAATGERFAAHVKTAIGELERDGFGVSALLVDTIFSSDGVFGDPAGFLAPAVAAVRAAGGLFIADEVQPGFGRTGAMWGFARHGLTPDIAVMGKPMGNGYPMAGVVLRPELLDRFGAEYGYFNTFGGGPVAAAVGMAVLDVIEDEGLVENARSVGAYFKQCISQVVQGVDIVREVRGAGLFIGVEFNETRPQRATTMAVIEGLKSRGVLIGAAGRLCDTIKIRPPLCFERQHADLFTGALEDTLKELCS